MNSKNIINKKVFCYIIGFIVFFGINVVIFKISNNSENMANIFSAYESEVVEAYEVDPDILQFDKDGIAILKVDTLIKGVTNGRDTYLGSNLNFTSNQDQCVGYIIVKKINDTTDFEIDTSHVCDMIDY